MYVTVIFITVFITLTLIQCNDDSVCTKSKPGVYECTCKDNTKKIQTEHAYLNNKNFFTEVQTCVPKLRQPANDDVHVVMCFEKSYAVAIPNLLRSIYINTNQRNRLSFHILHTQNDTSVDSLKQTLACRDIFDGQTPLLEHIEFKDSVIREKIKVYGFDEAEIQRFRSAANFARFYFHEVLPKYDKIIYIDADTVVQGDVVKLWDATDFRGHVLASTPDSNELRTVFLQSSDLKSLYRARYYSEIDLTVMGYNAGLALYNLKLWREEGFVDEVHYWMREQYKRQHWRIATQPLQTTVSYNVCFNKITYYKILTSRYYLSFKIIFVAAADDDVVVVFAAVTDDDYAYI